MPRLRDDVVRRFRPLADLVPPHWVTGSTAADDGTLLHWTDTASGGPPVILVHGLQSAGLGWVRTARVLERSHRVVLPDLRGHGASGRITTSVSTATFAADVAAVCDALGIGRPFIVGHSLGADVAGFLAAERELAGLVLVDPPLRDMAAAPAIDLDDPPPWVRTILDTLAALRTQSHRQRMVTGLGLLPPGPATDWDEVDYVGHVDGLAQFDPAVYGTLHLDRLADSPDVVAAIDCPILLLTGEPMPGVDLDAGVDAFALRWRRGRHVHVAGSGHAIHYDRFDRFVAVLTDFLDRHRDRAGT